MAAKKPATPARPTANPPAAAKDPAIMQRFSELGCRVRLRMYRHGLGDCHLLTFARAAGAPFQMLIDFGALNRDAKAMQRFAQHIEATLRKDAGLTDREKPRLDVIVATHEHKDHLSGFNQAREVFDRLEIGAVWMGWTEDPADREAQELVAGREAAMTHLRTALASPRLAALDVLDDVRGVLGFSGDHDEDDPAFAEKRTIAHALQYLRQQGEAAGAMKYLEPGSPPFRPEGVDGVRVYVLGPPRQRELLLRSDVTKKMQSEGVVYHLAQGLDAALTPNLSALTNLAARAGIPGLDDPFQPFGCEHRLTPESRWWEEAAAQYIAKTYHHDDGAWRRIDETWLGAFDQLAIKLAHDVNNTSLVLAFELEETGEVLLYVGDAQVGNWLSWANVSFEVEGQAEKVEAHDLLRRTVFYKVGHHASHNATLAKGGLELMTSEKLVAFVPLDCATAAMQGRKDQHGVPRGWEMPASALYEALKERTGGRVVISDTAKPFPKAARKAGIIQHELYYECRL